MKPRRQQAIRQLVSSRAIHSQHELQELLRAEGFEATQATLSRDLAELGVLKGPDGYRMPGEERPVALLSRLESTLRRELLSATVGGTLVVLRTPVGHGNALAVEIDAARLSGTLGTIAGDDTVFLAASGPAAARRLAKQITKLAGFGPSGRAPASGVTGGGVRVNGTPSRETEDSRETAEGRDRGGRR